MANSNRPTQPDTLKEAAQPSSDPEPAAAPLNCNLNLNPFTEDDWRFLLEKTETFAARELDRYCWREVSGGVVPGGYDANSIAAEAIAEFLRDRKARSLIRTPQELRKHLRKRARKIVNRLHHRTENEFMVSECDLDPTIHQDGEVIGALENFPAPDPDPAEEAIRHAETERLQSLKQQFILFLGDDQLLNDLFGCLCGGIVKRSAIARKLGLPTSLVTNAQKRLDRRLAEFLSQSPALLAAA